MSLNIRLVFFPVKTRGTKKSGVKVPLNKFAKQLISEEGRRDGLLFNLVSEQRMNLKIKEIALGAGIVKKLSNHSGRHTFATNYLRKTKDVAGLQQLLGHSDIGQTMIYAHITDEMLTEEMANFEAAIFSKNGGSESATSL